MKMSQEKKFLWKLSPVIISTVLPPHFATSLNSSWNIGHSGLHNSCFLFEGSSPEVLVLSLDQRVPEATSQITSHCTDKEGVAGHSFLCQAPEMTQDQGFWITGQILYCPWEKVIWHIYIKIKRRCLEICNPKKWLSVYKILDHKGWEIWKTGKYLVPCYTDTK